MNTAIIIPEFLYHITPYKNLNKILKEGLIPDTKNSGICVLNGRKQRRRLVEKYGIQPIFLTTSPKLVVDTQAGPGWIKTYNPALLKIETTNLILEDEFDYLKEKWSKQYTSYETAIKVHPLGVHYICRHAIPKDSIKQVTFISL